MAPYPQNLHGALWPNCISGMVAINRLWTITNALSNASISHPPLLHQTGVLTPTQKHWLQIAAKPLQIATWSLLTAYRNVPTPYPTVPSPTLYRHSVLPKYGFRSPLQKCMVSGSTVAAILPTAGLLVNYRHPIIRDLTWIGMEWPRGNGKNFECYTFTRIYTYVAMQTGAIHK